MTMTAERENAAGGSAVSGGNLPESAASFPNWKDILSIVAVFIAASFLVGIFVGAFVKAEGGFPMFLSYVLSFVIVIAYALALKKVRTGSLEGVMKFSARGLDPVVILWGVVLILAVNVVMEPLIELFPEKYLDLISRTLNNGGWAMMTSIIAAPVFEEILFRGIIQDSIAARYGVLRGILASSLIFGIVHVIPQQVVTAAVLGVVLGYVYYRTGSLVSVIVIHALNNALALFSMIITGDAAMTLREATGGGNLYYMIYGASAVMVVLSAVRIVSVLGRPGKAEQESAAAPDISARETPEQ